MAKTPTWQRAAGKNPEGGLNEAGRRSLRAAGHDIKRPQPEGGPRKKSFCARMKGMKAHNTSAETANDPDSRINKSLRKWKCADGGEVTVDNALRMARGRPDEGGQERFLREQLAGSAPQYEPSKDFPARAERAVQAADRYAGMLNDLAAAGMMMPEQWRHPQGRSAREIVESALPQDPNAVAKQAMQQWREGDKAGAVETMAGGLPETGAIRAYHGSPHRFDKFDLSKIGTGEGAQAYGHGLYFAESEPVARSYRDILSKDIYKTESGETFDPSRLRHLNVRYLARSDIDAAIEKAKKVIEDQGTIPNTRDLALADLRDLERAKAAGAAFTPGHMYEVEIAAEPHQLLDWDRPLSEQSPQVRNIIRKSDFYKKALDEYKNQKQWYLDPRQKTGESYLKYMRAGVPSEELGVLNPEKSLLEAGIPGIQYLDAGSRSAGEGSRNFVIFDPSIIDIKRRYADGGDVTVDNALRMARNMGGGTLYNQLNYALNSPTPANPPQDPGPQQPYYQSLPQTRDIIQQYGTPAPGAPTSSAVRQPMPYAGGGEVGLRDLGGSRRLSTMERLGLAAQEYFGPKQEWQTLRDQIRESGMLTPNPKGQPYTEALSNLKTMMGYPAIGQPFTYHRLNDLPLGKGTWAPAAESKGGMEYTPASYKPMPDKFPISPSDADKIDAYTRHSMEGATSWRQRGDPTEMPTTPRQAMNIPQRKTTPAASTRFMEMSIPAQAKLQSKFLPEKALSQITDTGITGRQFVPGVNSDQIVASDAIIPAAHTPSSAQIPWEQTHYDYAHKVDPQHFPTLPQRELTSAGSTSMRGHIWGTQQIDPSIKDPNAERAQSRAEVDRILQSMKQKEEAPQVMGPASLPGGGVGKDVDTNIQFPRMAKGGAIWNKPRPKSLGKSEPLSPSQKASAKAMAKAAGRPYPNMVDNLRAARKADGGQVEGDVQFAPSDLPMMARQPDVEIENALRMARGRPDETSQQRFLKEQLAGSAPQYDPEAGLRTAKEAGQMIAGMTTPGAIADIGGYLGGPSLRENIREGNYGTAAMQALGAVPVAGPIAKGLGAAKLAMFLGAGAKIADKTMLAKAEKMLESGISREDVFNQTGWFRGVDGKMRFEVPDNEAALKGYIQQGAQFEGKLPEVITHPILYEAYPTLRDVDVNYGHSAVGHGAYSPPMGGIHGVDENIRITSKATNPLSTGLHETQHAIQNREGFAPGSTALFLKKGTPAWEIYKERMKAITTPLDHKTFSMAANYDGLSPLKDYQVYLKMVKKPNPIVDKAAQEYAVGEAYKRSAGEVEARTTQKRINMTEDERRARAPWLDYDVPEDKQIIKYR